MFSCNGNVRLLVKKRLLANSAVRLLVSVILALVFATPTWAFLFLDVVFGTESAGSIRQLRREYFLYGGLQFIFLVLFVLAMVGVWCSGSGIRSPNKHH